MYGKMQFLSRTPDQQVLHPSTSANNICMSFQIIHDWNVSHAAHILSTSVTVTVEKNLL